MSIKISQFIQIPTVDATTIFPVVDPAGPTSYKADLSQLATFILEGNAATATNLAASTDTLASTVLYSSLTSVGTLLDLTVTNTISGSIDGNAATVTDGVYTTDNGTVTNTMLAGSIENSKLVNSSITINGVTIALGASDSISTSIAPATTSVIGGIIVGEGLAVQVDGTLSVAITKLFHGFSVNTDGDLIYSTTTDSTINLQDQYGKDIYETTDIGTDEYSYSMDGDGNLIVTFA